jgi:glycerol-3-phosphate dehydrogenase
MGLADKVNRKLLKYFGNRVRAVEADGSLLLEGNLDNWNDVVLAGSLAAKCGKKSRAPKRPHDGIQRSGYVVNNIHFSGAEIPPMIAPKKSDAALEGRRPDVLVIGGGVTGCAIARELSRYDLDVLLVEKEHDLAVHASGRNDGMVHPGIDLRKGSWKHYYNSRGNALYDKTAAELGVEFERGGQYLCFSRKWLPLLCLSLVYWKWLGVPGVRVLGEKKLRRVEPNLREDLRAALFFPTAGVVCPYELTIALGENAVQNGARLSLDTAVLGMETAEGRINTVMTNRGTIHPRVVVNAAGVFAEDIAAMAGDRFYSIHPRRGTNSILDKKYTAGLVHTIASRIGSSAGDAPKDAAGPAVKQSGHTKGGGMVRTIHDNLLVGPDAVETHEKENFATCASSVEGVFGKFKDVSPRLDRSQIITYFTGVRAPTYEEDFVVCKGRRTINLVHAAGIQSPGLTAAPAVAEDAARFAVELLEAAGAKVKRKQRFNPLRKPIPRTSRMSDGERDALIKRRPDYGIIYCRCEEVSKGEILDSLHRPVPCDTLDGVKRRVRPGMGRCQGGFCGPLVLQLIAGEKGIAPEEVSKRGPGSEILCGKNKAGSGE